MDWSLFDRPLTSGLDWVFGGRLTHVAMPAVPAQEVLVIRGWSFVARDGRRWMLVTTIP